MSVAPLLPRPRGLRLGHERVEAREPAQVLGASLPAQGYRVVIDASAVRIDAADEAGAFYARATLDQLARTHGGRLPVGEIVDWPDVAIRGVMLDISRDKVPSFSTLAELVDRLASWKLNQLELYTEHTFAYTGHEEVWENASPLGADEVRALDALCRERHVELVPNQNCLGHMERWLARDRYRPLAIRPGGFEQWGRHRGPTTLDPALPGSFELVRGLLGELAPCFASRRIHVGLDEPFELPAERAGEYLDWLARLRALEALEGREMLVWGDVLATHPEWIGKLPEGVTVCEWGYEADHPFAERARALARGGQPFWVCPGTSAWLSILGRTTNMRGNMDAAAAAASEHGAAGFLITDWGDFGHLQVAPVSDPGLAYGAAISWCAETNRDLDLAAALDAHAYFDAAGELGAALLALGDAHRGSRMQVPNVAATLLHLWFPEWSLLGAGRPNGLCEADYRGIEAILDESLARLARSRPERADGALVLDELRNACALVRVLCRDARARLEADATLPSIPEATRFELARALEPVIDEHRRLWLARNREGGLADSTARLEHLRRCYLTGTTPPP